MSQKVLRRLRPPTAFGSSPDFTRRGKRAVGRGGPAPYRPSNSGLKGLPEAIRVSLMRDLAMSCVSNL